MLVYLGVSLRPYARLPQYQTSNTSSSRLPSIPSRQNVPYIQGHQKSDCRQIPQSSDDFRRENVEFRSGSMWTLRKWVRRVLNFPFRNPDTYISKRHSSGRLSFSMCKFLRRCICLGRQLDGPARLIS